MIILFISLPLNTFIDLKYSSPPLEIAILVEILSNIFIEDHSKCHQMSLFISLFTLFIGLAFALILWEIPTFLSINWLQLQTNPPEIHLLVPTWRHRSQEVRVRGRLRAVAGLLHASPAEVRPRVRRLLDLQRLADSQRAGSDSRHHDQRLPRLRRSLSPQHGTVESEESPVLHERQRRLEANPICSHAGLHFGQTQGDDGQHFGRGRPVHAQPGCARADKYSNIMSRV